MTTCRDLVCCLPGADGGMVAGVDAGEVLEVPFELVPAVLSMVRGDLLSRLGALLLFVVIVGSIEGLAHGVPTVLAC